MKIFISQPMRGFTEEEIAEERERLKNMFYGNDIIGNYVSNRECASKHKNPSIYNLGLSIVMMCEADLVVLPHNTWDYPGCRVEAEVASSYDIPIVRINMYPDHIEPCCDAVKSVG